MKVTATVTYVTYPKKSSASEIHEAFSLEWEGTDYQELFQKVVEFGDAYNKALEKSEKNKLSKEPKK